MFRLVAGGDGPGGGDGLVIRRGRYVVVKCGRVSIESVFFEIFINLVG